MSQHFDLCWCFRVLNCVICASDQTCSWVSIASHFHVFPLEIWLLNVYQVAHMLKPWSPVCSTPGNGGTFRRRGPGGGRRVKESLPLEGTLEPWPLPLSLSLFLGHHEMKSFALSQIPTPCAGLCCHRPQSRRAKSPWIW